MRQVKDLGAELLAKARYRAGWWRSTSMRSRVAVSLAANIVRAGAGFVSGLIVARGLEPARYGDFTFLLGSFVALRTLLDLGTSNAFYTFLAQRPRPAQFYRFYAGWLAFQFGVTTLALGVLLPQSVVSRIWLGHDRSLLLLAFAASFAQQQIWQTVVLIGEASRKTIRVQLLGVAIVLVHLLVVSGLYVASLLSVVIVLELLLVEYTVGALIAWSVAKDDRAGAGEEAWTPRTLIGRFQAYCRPLVLTAAVGFVVDFADRWMLQRFGGAMQQGFYQVAFQFSAVSLLATTSVLQPYWKEIAEASGRADAARVLELYRRASRGLVIVGAVVSGALIPWSPEIVSIALGPSYQPAWPVLAIMLMYPIHQALGQVVGTTYLASGETTRYMRLSLLIMAASVPISYAAMAPASAPIPGLGLGAVGMALKMTIVNIASVNLFVASLARMRGWKHDWTYQIAAVLLTLGIGVVARALVVGFGTLPAHPGWLSLVGSIGGFTVVYAVGIAAVLGSWMRSTGATFWRARASAGDRPAGVRG